MNISKTGAGPSAALIITRNLVFFLFSFMWSGSFTIIPQIFFLEHYPADKNVLVSLFLVTGTVFSIAGIQISQRKLDFQNIGKIFPRVVGFSIFISGASFLGLFATKNLAFYFAALIVFKFFSNYLYNYLDQYFTRSLPKERLGLYINVNVFYQLIGIVLGNLYFSFFYRFAFLHSALILGLSAVAAAAIILKSGDWNPSGGEEKEAVSRKEKLNKSYVYFLLYTALALLLVMVFGAFMIYALKDYYQLENSQKIGGILLGMTTLSGALYIVLISIAKSGKAGRSAGKERLGMATALFVLGVAGLIFYSRLSYSILYVSVPGFLGGVGYGILTLSTRNYAARQSIKDNNPKLLSFYNNLSNWAMLGAFLTTALISGAGYYFSFDFFKILFLVLLLILSLSGLFLVLFVRASARNSS